MLDHDCLTDNLSTLEIYEMALGLFEKKPHHAFFFASKIKDDYLKVLALVSFSESLIGKNDSSCDLLLKFTTKYAFGINDVVTKIMSLSELVPILCVVDSKKACLITDEISRIAFNIDDNVTRISALIDVFRALFYRGVILKENMLENLEEYLFSEMIKLDNGSDKTSLGKYFLNSFLCAEDHITNLKEKSIISKDGEPIIKLKTNEDRFYYIECVDEYFDIQSVYQSLGMNFDGYDFSYAEKLSEDETVLKKCCEQIQELCLDKHLDHEEKNNNAVEDLDVSIVSLWLAHM